MATRLSIAKPDIVRFFREKLQKTYTKSDIDKLLAQNRQGWRLAQSTTVNQFIEFLLAGTELKKERLAFPYRPVIRYTWGKVETFAIVQSINPDGYFTHFTAMHLHGLTEQLPKSIFFNQEQQATGGGGTLRQGAINRAFRTKCRTSSNTAKFRDYQIHLLNGQNTRELGVIEITTNEGLVLRVTNIERTLIDATVRPIYSGGVFEVAKAYAQAHDSLSVNKLVAILRQLNFTYPYHQAIGFYLERTGLYKQTQLDLLRKLPIKYDFYLDYGLKEMDYNKSWRLFIPKGFETVNVPKDEIKVKVEVP